MHAVQSFSPPASHTKKKGAHTKPRFSVDDRRGASLFESVVLSELRALGDTSGRIEQHLLELRAQQRAPCVAEAAQKAQQEQESLDWRRLAIVPVSQPGDDSDTPKQPEDKHDAVDADPLTHTGSSASQCLAPQMEKATDADPLQRTGSSASQALAPQAEKSLQDRPDRRRLQTPLAEDTWDLSSLRSRSTASASRGAGPDGKFVASSLPLDWPAVLKMRTTLAAAEDSLSPLPTSTLQRCTVRTGRTTFLEEGQASHSIRKSRYALDPNSRQYMAYSVLSLFILAYDLTLLPYVLAWDLEMEGFLYVSAWITPLFWTFDIGINFLTGYYKGGEIILDLRQIGRAYLKSWFTPDASVVCCDWTSLLMGVALDSGDDSRSLKMLRFSKLGRLLRIVGMIRMLRVVRILEELSAMYFSEFYRLVFKLISLLAGILWLAHLLACLWYAIGSSAPSDTGRHWVDFYLRADLLVPFMESGPIYQYAVSYHWAVAQIALGGVDITPATSLERGVYVLAIMFGFLFGSSLVSMLSAAMMEYRMMQKDKTLKLRTLRRYLQEREVSGGLAVRVQKQVEQRLAHRECVAEDDVAALQLLSAGLRSELRFEIQQPDLIKHPLFRLWTGMDVKWMERVCMRAVSFTHLRPKDELFAPSNTASAAIALVRGEMAYVQYPDTSPVLVETSQRVSPGQWFCEAALWVEWTHVGRAEAEDACHLLSISAEALSQSVQQDFIIRGVAAEYGRQFHKRVTSAFPPQAPWPTDLQVPFTDYCDLVVSMPKSVQLTIGREALSQLPQHRGAKAMDKLREEVESSKSIVVVTGDGAITRVVSLVVLRATTCDDHVFMQIGKYEGVEVKNTFQLPGVKREADELVSDTLARMFRTRLSLLSGKIEFVGTQRENMEKESKEYGVQTRYMRSICSARLRTNVELDAPVCVWQPGDALVDESGMLKSLSATKVYAVSSGDASGNLYAWVPPDSLGPLGVSSGDRVLQAWLSGLKLPFSSN